ncbi:MAG: hypothetical protein QXW00_00705 [Candidatus Woesearchaeota archaeon]
MANTFGLEDQIIKFCKEVENIEDDLTRLLKSKPDSQFVKSWPTSKQEYLDAIRNYCLREEKELPKKLYSKNLKQLKGMYYGIFKEDGKKRYYYRNFLNEYELALSNLLNTSELKIHVEKKDYAEVLRTLIGDFAYKTLSCEELDQYHLIIQRASSRTDPAVSQTFYSLRTCELEKLYRNYKKMESLMQDHLEKLF